MTTTRQQNDPLNDNLTQHLACAQALLELLAKERDALLTNDITELERISSSKASAAGTLQTLSGKLNRICGSRDGGDIEAYIRRTDNHGNLKQWQALTHLASRCQQENLANGVLLQERHNRVRSTLQILRQDARPMYGRSGVTATSDARRALARA